MQVNFSLIKIYLHLVVMFVIFISSMGKPKWLTHQIERRFTMTNASRHGVQDFENIVGFDNDGAVVYSVTGTIGTMGTLNTYEEAARGLGAVKMVSILDGERSTWYKWNGERFVCVC